MTRTRWILALSLAMTAPVFAQTGEVVQATPSAEAVAALNRHLSSLSRSPQNLTALLGAGQAALDLGDVQAANGFFTRANMVDGSSGKAKLGLAIVQIALKQPEDAAANFDAAAALGVPATGHLSDRGLAYDLTGQQAKAQLDYRAALAANPNDQTARTRFAVSLGISGQLAEANQQLEAALAGGDREAWRMRAFILAMNGRISDARSVTQSMMPKGLADAIDPYLQRLPLLTATQKAAAAHYGDYPANVLRLAAPEPTREGAVAVAAASTRDTGSRRDRRRREAAEREAAERKAAEREIAQRQAARDADARRQSAKQVAAATPAPVAAVTRAPQPAREAAATPSREPVRAATARPTATMPSYAPEWARPQDIAQSSQSVAATPTPTPTPSRPVMPTASMAQGPSDPGTTMPPRPATPAPSSFATAAPAQASVPQPQPAQPEIVQPVRSLADTLQTLEVPAQERQQAAVMADLQTVARIRDQRRKAAEAAQAKAKVEAEAKAKADAAKKAEAERKAKLAASPSRNWVQIATGRDVDALAFDLRRMRRTYADALGDRDGFTAEWGQTRRLLIGPFRKTEDAKAVVAQIVKAGGDAFMWQSAAGEEVTQIGGK